MKKILVVDDEPGTRKILVVAVESLGYMAIQSPNGKHALETIGANPDIALVITDMVMPMMDGRTLILGIQKKKGLTKLPVIIMSAAVTVKDISDLLQLGARAFVQKPLNVSEIKEYVTRYLES